MSTALGLAIAATLAAGCSAAPSTSAPPPRPTVPPTIPAAIGNATTTIPSSRTTTTTLPATGAFVARSATFISSEIGWVLGTTECGSPTCGTVLLRTSDAGSTWTRIPAPPIVDTPTSQIRFANDEDGWVYDDQAQTGPDLWETHDGGAEWSLVSIPGLAPEGTISDLEAADGRVDVAYRGIPIQIASSPVGTDDWSVSGTTIPIGAGPVPFEQIVLQGSSGWIVETDRVVTGGARLVDGSWEPWTPPCSGTNGPVYLATSGSPDDLVALCEPGEWGPPSNKTSLYISNDGAATFEAAGAAQDPRLFGIIASPAPGVVVVGSSQAGLVATFDEGGHWASVYESGVIWVQIGFTTPNQGLAIGQDGLMVMTYDGGHQWTPVDFPPLI